MDAAKDVPEARELHALYRRLPLEQAPALCIHRAAGLKPHDLHPAISHLVRPPADPGELRDVVAAVGARYPKAHPLVVVRRAGTEKEEARSLNVGAFLDEAAALHPAGRSGYGDIPWEERVGWLYIPPLQPELGNGPVAGASGEAAGAGEEGRSGETGPCRHPLDGLVNIMARLRGPGGCPWDREQDHDTLRPYLIEEAYEAVDAIEAKDFGKLVEELGDVLLQVVFHSQLGAEANRFTIDDVVRTVSEKMIRRHPHVFGNVEARDSAAVLRNWEAIKQREAASKGDSPKGDEEKSLLAGIPRHLPALAEAEKVQSRAARVGFQWATVEGAEEKVWEEWRELQEARRGGDPGRIAEEWGDLLFALVNVARYLGVDSELALRNTTRKFRLRFAQMEARAREMGRDLRSLRLEELDRLWDEAKEGEGRN